MIKIKDYIFNENEIEFIKKIENGLIVCPKAVNVDIKKIENATFEDIEWNYGGTFKILSEEEQLRQNGENNKDKILELRNDLIDKLQNQIKELEEENERLKAEVDLLNDNRHYLNNKIGKAIKYIKTNTYSVYDKKTTIYEDVVLVDKLLNILKGGEEID